MQRFPIALEINQEVAEEQPWTMKDIKYAMALGKFKPPSFGNNYLANEAVRQVVGLKSNSNSNNNNRNKAMAQQHRQTDDRDDSGADVIDYVYEFDDRFMAPLTAGSNGPAPDNDDQDDNNNGNRFLNMLPRKRAAYPRMPTATTYVDEADPRIMPLFGSHAALTKLQKSNDVLLKKILRQAGQCTDSYITPVMVIQKKKVDSIKSNRDSKIPSKS